MTTVVFACVHNAGRSQMAAALFNAFAGTAPAAQVHPEVVVVMRERGVDLAHARPARLTNELADGAQWLITMGCGDQCPFVPGATLEDWPLDDPRGRPLAEVRAIRDEIARRVAAFVDAHAWRPTPAP